MHCIQAQKAGLALRLRLAPLADRDRCGPCFGVVQESLAIARMLAQVIQVSDGNRSQPRILRPLVEQVFAFQDAPCRRAAQRLVRFVHAGQQLDVVPRVQLCETPPSIDRHLDPSADCIQSDQPCDLCPAQPGHLLDVAPHQASRRLAQLAVLPSGQHLLHPAIELLAVFGLKPDRLAGPDKPANRLQTQLFCVVHADVHYPA